MKENYTSLELSKKLAEAGCKLESNHSWRIYHIGDIILENDCVVGNHEEVQKIVFATDKDYSPIIQDFIPAFDILNEICCKYALEFFETKKGIYTGRYVKILGEFKKEQDLDYSYHPSHILYLMRLGKKQEAEDYLWSACRFSKVNKKE